jgi:hypothetical protein
MAFDWRISMRARRSFPYRLQFLLLQWVNLTITFAPPASSSFHVHLSFIRHRKCKRLQPWCFRFVGFPWRARRRHNNACVIFFSIRREENRVASYVRNTTYYFIIL